MLSILRVDVGFSKLTWHTYPKVTEHWSRHAIWSERLYLVSSRRVPTVGRLTALNLTSITVESLKPFRAISA